MDAILLPDGSQYSQDPASGLWRHIPDPNTAAALGVDENALTLADAIPGPTGDDWPSVNAPPAAPEAPAPTSNPAPAAFAPESAASAASSITWGGRIWTADNLTSFIAYLAAHGTDYSTWALNHPDAAAVLTGPPTDPSREPVPKSIGEALVAYLQGGSSPAQAADQTEALRAALVAEGVSSVTPGQLLQDATVAAQTLATEAGQLNPPTPPAVGTAPETPLRALAAVDASQREAGDLTNLPPIPAGFRTIANDQVTEGLVISAALIEYADPWIMLGTCKQESGFNVETTANSAGAHGPMQIVSFPGYDASTPLIVWVWGNLIAGARLLAKYAAVYNGDQQKMSAAYNAGPGAVNSHWPGVLQWLEVAGNPKAGTVQDYVDAVAKYANSYASAFGGGWNIDPATGNLIHGVPGPIVGIGPAPVTKTPAGVNVQWRTLMEAIGTTSPKRRDEIARRAAALASIFS